MSDRRNRLTENEERRDSEENDSVEEDDVVCENWSVKPKIVHLAGQPVVPEDEPVY